MYKKMPSQVGIIWLVVPSVCMALVLHPSLNGNFFTDVAWTMACYLETMAMIPQLYLFSRFAPDDAALAALAARLARSSWAGGQDAHCCPRRAAAAARR